MATNALPSHTTVLVIGGGPGGAYTAAVLAREGIQVTVAEAAKFPRYHIGESMLPSLGPFMGFIGAEEKLRAHGFELKRGSAIKFNQHKKEGYTDFLRGSIKNASWNVIRSEFDDMLLRHAEELGAAVFEQTKITEIKFAEPQVEGNLRPTSALYTRQSGETGEISFDYLVDASGRNGLMSTKYLKNRKMNKSLHNIACWGYWTGHGRYMPGTYRDNAPWFEALTDESGWGWFIPLHDGTVSVGVVIDSSISAQKKSKMRQTSLNGEYSLKNHYLDQFEFLPGLKRLLGGATLKEDEGDGIKSAADFSYAADCYAGDHFRLVGDASAFLDPFFSSGVHLALHGGLTAAASIAASLKKQCTEELACEFHDVKVGIAYTRFLMVVMSGYTQMRNQKIEVLSDVNEDNFDRAFDLIRPVIQGTADVGKTLTEDELQKTLDFCKEIYGDTDPEMVKAVGARIRPELLEPNAPFLTDEQIAAEAKGDEEVTILLHNVNARKQVDDAYKGPANLTLGAVNGYVAHLQRGSLGLVPSKSA